NWLYHSDATLTFPQTVVLRYKFQEPGVADAAVEGYSRWFVSRLKLLERELEHKEYLCCDRFTIADICVSYAINLAGSLGIEQAYKPNIKRWTDQLFDRPSFIKSRSYKYEEN
ncbi:glutathione S-transferase family protein, partial [Gammaproteobacteria bacterium]|nr:glutathione S-transferase family protein [Gammaproteobacteria bacterium]